MCVKTTMLLLLKRVLSQLTILFPDSSNQKWKQKGNKMGREENKTLVKNHNTAS